MWSKKEGDGAGMAAGGMSSGVLHSRILQGNLGQPRAALHQKLACFNGYMVVFRLFRSQDLDKS